MRIAIVFLAGMLASASAQEIKMPPGLERLGAKAEESVDVTLDGPLLQFASRVLSDKDPDEARAKKIVAGLKGIYVRSFEFAKEGEYNQAEIDAFRAQLQPPTWSRVAGVKSSRGGENAEVYFKMATGGDIGGLVVIAAEPKELTIVNIVGTIKPEDLADLSGEFGIPKLDFGARRQTSKQTPPPAPPKSKGKEPE